MPLLEHCRTSLKDHVANLVEYTILDQLQYYDCLIHGLSLHNHLNEGGVVDHIWLQLVEVSLLKKKT